VSDRILLRKMRFVGRHGVPEEERREAQPFSVDVEMELDLGSAGRSDDLAATVDYSVVYERIRVIVETRTFRLVEALAESIASEVLLDPRVDAVTVRVRKPGVRLGGPLAFAGVEIRRSRG
jgi:dihydroneopterin aldolase